MSAKLHNTDVFEMRFPISPKENPLFDEKPYRQEIELERQSTTELV